MSLLGSFMSNRLQTMNNFDGHGEVIFRSDVNVDFNFKSIELIKDTLEDVNSFNVYFKEDQDTFSLVDFFDDLHSIRDFLVSGWFELIARGDEYVTIFNPERKEWSYCISK